MCLPPIAPSRSAPSQATAGEIQCGLSDQGPKAVVKEGRGGEFAFLYHSLRSEPKLPSFYAEKALVVKVMVAS